MPIKNFLSQEQKQSLQQALRESEQPELRERVLMLLLMNEGKTYEQIASFIGCSQRTVAYWCVHGDPDKIESLKDKRGIGNYRKATTEYVKVLLETIEKEPSELGYEFGRWTGERLATYLAVQTGIELSGSQVRKILKQKKYVYLWAKYSLEDKQNPLKRSEFKQKLAQYLDLAKIKPDQLQIWFWDVSVAGARTRATSGFSLRVLRRKTWGKKGKRKKITGQRRRGRVNVMGGLRLSDKKRLCYFIKKGNAETFYEQLKQLNEFVLKEWLAQGNRAENFQSQGPKIVIILDNASYHKRKDIIADIEKDFPNIILEFLPAYSPDFNLIELVWHSCKEYIAHRLFQSVTELEEVLNKLLNEGELIIKWARKIKNKGNAVNAS
jgi:transposase